MPQHLVNCSHLLKIEIIWQQNATVSFIKAIKLQFFFKMKRMRTYQYLSLLVSFSYQLKTILSQNFDEILH